MISTKRCSKCIQPCKSYAKKEKTAKQLEEEGKKEDARILEILDGLKEREKKTIRRKLALGEIDYDPKGDRLVYVETNEEFNVGQQDDDDSDDGSDMDSDGEDDNMQ